MILIDHVVENLLHAHVYSYIHGAKAPNPDIHVRCDDPYDLCGSCTVGQGEYIAYNIGNEPHINFCPGYFRLGELSAIVNEMTKTRLRKRIWMLTTTEARSYSLVSKFNSD